MKIHTPVKLLACLAVCVMATLLTAPSSTTAIFALDSNTLLTVLAVKWAFNIGAALGQASRSRGRSYGRRRSYGRSYGKREAETFSDNSKDLDDLETNLISDGFDLMMKSDPSDCFRRLICDVSTGEEKFVTLAPILNFVADDEDNYVPPQIKEFSYKLKLARKIGENGRNSNFCEETFKCPFTGEDMLKMTIERFNIMKPDYLPRETDNVE